MVALGGLLAGGAVMYIIALLTAICLVAFVVRWVLRINDLVDAVMSIDQSLQAMPAARQMRAAKYRDSRAA